MGALTNVYNFTRAGRRSRGLLITLAALVVASILQAPLAKPAAAATCGLSVQIIASPFAVVDSNKPGVEGPRAATLGARIVNTSGATVPDVNATFSSDSLGLLNGGPATYFLNDLKAGASVTAYWPITYPATFNVSYGYNITAANGQGCSASASSQIKTESQISATANKLLPTGATINITPNVVTPGSLVTVKVTGFTLGTVGQGPNATYDAWFQPIGNGTFDPTCIRLVRSEIKLNSISATPYVDRLYFTNLNAYRSNGADYAAYTFIGLRACSSVIQPYQEAASGTQEKYNSDYSANTIGVTSDGTSSLVVTIQPSTPTAGAGDTIHYTVSFSSPTAPVGYPSNGNPAVIQAEIPAETTYVGASATVLSTADTQYSTDDGNTWSATQPANAGSVTDIRWVMQAPVDATTVQVSYDVTVDSNYSGAPLVVDASGSLLDGTTLTSSATTVAPAPTPTPTATATATSTPAPTATTTATATPGPSATPSPTTTPTATSTAGPTGTPTATATPGPTATPTTTATPSATATVPNVAPVAGDDSLQIGMNAPSIVNVVANDTDADGNIDPSSVTAAATPYHGSIVNRRNGSFTYTPAPGYIGPDRFSYRVCDTGGLCDYGLVIIYAGWDQLRWEETTTHVAYEDLKNAGWSDWDYNDFVVKIRTRIGSDASDQVAALVMNYEAMARGAGYYHRFVHGLPVDGGGFYMLAVNDAAGNAVIRKNTTFGTNTDIAIFNQTRQALPPPAGIFETNTRPSQASAEPGYTASLTVYLDDRSLNPTAALPPTPWDPYILVYNTNQEVHLLVPGHLDNTQTVNAAFDRNSPLVGYDLPLARTFVPGWKWPVETKGIWMGYPKYVNYVSSGGTGATDWWSAANAEPNWVWPPSGGAAGSPGAAASGQPGGAEAVDSRYFASPVLADLTGDGEPEIIIGNLLKNQVEVYDANRQPLAGWPQAVDGPVKATVAVADLDGDGKVEILAGSSGGKLYAWRMDGVALPGWPVTLDAAYRVLATPAVGDLDGDGVKDVVTPLANGKLYAFDASGALKAGWPVSLGDIADRFNSQVINSSPRIADLDGDGKPEIVVGSTDRRIYVFNSNGTVRWWHGTGDLVLSTPAVADVDTSRPGLEVVAGSGDRYVYLLSAGGELIWRRATGWTVRSSPAIADLNSDGKPEIIIGSDDDKLWAWHADGKLVAGWPRPTGADVFSSPVVGDVDGDGQVDVVVGSDDARVYAWSGSGTRVTGWPRAGAESVKGAPALANLDDDPGLEVVAADLGGSLHVWDQGVDVFQHGLFLPFVTMAP